MQINPQPVQKEQKEQYTKDFHNPNCKTTHCQQVNSTNIFPKVKGSGKIKGIIWQIVDETVKHETSSQITDL